MQNEMTNISDDNSITYNEDRFYMKFYVKGKEFNLKFNGGYKDVKNSKCDESNILTFTHDFYTCKFTGKFYVGDTKKTINIQSDSLH